jgi:hypothetical protein
VTYSKLPLHLAGALAIAAFSMLGIGCAFEPGATPDESIEQSEGDLQKASATTVDVHTPADPNETVILKQPPLLVAPVVIATDNLLGGGTDEGPRPHPWQPPPETSETSGGVSGSSDGKK